MAEDDGQQPGSSAPPSIQQFPAMPPPCPHHSQMYLGPVIYVPGVIRPGPGNRPVFVPGPGPGIPAYLQGRQSIGSWPPASPPGSSSAAVPQLQPQQLLYLRPQSQSHPVQSYTDAETQSRARLPFASDSDSQARLGRDSKAKLKEPERRLPPEPQVGPPEIQHGDFKGQEPQEKEVPMANPRRGWRPKWLRQGVLMAFAAWFLVLAAAVEVVFYLTTRENGIAMDPPPNMFYLWTMGPPAVFAVTAMCWDRVNYQAMRLMPWIQLNDSPSDASQSIALDYHSRAFAPTVFIAALRNRHYLVSCTTLAALLLRVPIVLSAGMIFLEPSGPGFVTSQLLVRPIVLHVMAGILVAEAVLSVIAAWRLGQPRFPPANPETIMGMALDLMHSTKLLRKLSGSGPLTLNQTKNLVLGTYRTIQRPSSHNASTDSLTPPTFTVSCAPEAHEYPSPAPAPASMELESGTGTGINSYSPPILRIFPRIVASALLLAMLGAVVALFQLSGGLPPGFISVDSPTTTDTHYIWTSVPMLLAVCVSLYFSAVDGQIRSHAGFLFLQRDRATTETTTSTTVEEIFTNFGDRLPTTALFKAFEMPGEVCWQIVLSATSAILGVLLCVVSGAVFFAASGGDANPFLGATGGGAAIEGEEKMFLMKLIPTYVVIGLLAALLLLNLGLLALVFPPSRKRLPMIPKSAPATSILAVASLLADSNVFERFPLAAEYMSRDEICTLFSGVGFRLGWFEKPEGDGVVFAIGIVEDGE